MQMFSCFTTLFVLGYLYLLGADAFAPSHSQRCRRSSSLNMGLVNDLKLIFSEEGKKNRAAYDARERAEQERLQKELLELRRNPKKKAEYEKNVFQRRKELDDERSVWKFQNDNSGLDPLKAWNDLRSQGKIKVGSDLERDPTSSRLGSEGLVDVRVDERMPYIDQGYVDEDADVMGNFMKMFRGGKKNE